MRGRKAGRLPQHFGTPLVHAQRRGHHAAAGVGNAHQFQRTLNGAVLAVTTMQGNEYAVICFQIMEWALGRVESVCIHTTALQRRQHRVAAIERHFALG